MPDNKEKKTPEPAPKPRPLSDILNTPATEVVEELRRDLTKEQIVEKGPLASGERSN